DLPGRGLSLAWSPDDAHIAVSGRFGAPSPAPRYDIKLYDTKTGAFDKEFGCPVYFTSATTWSDNPFIGPAIVGGNYGHAAFVYNADGPGTTRCSEDLSTGPHAVAADGWLKTLGSIDGAVTWLRFSPGGRFLAASNRDPSIRVWQIDPSP